MFDEENSISALAAIIVYPWYAILRRPDLMDLLRKQSILRIFSQVLRL